MTFNFEFLCVVLFKFFLATFWAHGILNVPLSHLHRRVDIFVRFLISLVLLSYLFSEMTLEWAVFNVFCAAVPFSLLFYKSKRDSRESRDSRDSREVILVPVKGNQRQERVTRNTSDDATDERAVEQEQESVEEKKGFGPLQPAVSNHLQRQLIGDCFSHAATRCLVRVMQICLGDAYSTKEKLEEAYHDIHAYITMHMGINGGLPDEAMNLCLGKDWRFCKDAGLRPALIPAESESVCVRDLYNLREHLRVVQYVFLATISDNIKTTIEVIRSLDTSVSRSAIMAGLETAEALDWATGTILCLQRFINLLYVVDVPA
jgi:hypothetical protein